MRRLLTARRLLAIPYPVNCLNTRCTIQTTSAVPRPRLASVIIMPRRPLPQHMLTLTLLEYCPVKWEFHCPGMRVCTGLTRACPRCIISNNSSKWNLNRPLPLLEHVSCCLLLNRVNIYRHRHQHCPGNRRHHLPLTWPVSMAALWPENNSNFISNNCTVMWITLSIRFKIPLSASRSIWMQNRLVYWQLWPIHHPPIILI